MYNLMIIAIFLTISYSINIQKYFGVVLVNLQFVQIKS